MTAETPVPDTLVAMIQRSLDLHGDRDALWIPAGGAFEPVSYSRLGEQIRELGAGLIHLGLREREPVAIISDNRPEWIIADLAILSAGCHDVPRGSDSTAQEIAYILNHSGARMVVVEDERQLRKVRSIRDECPGVERIIVLDDRYEEEEDRAVFPMAEVVRRGKGSAGTFDSRSAGVKPGDLCTIIYTSGTTGNPKGVMLTHSNVMHNVRVLPPLIDLQPEDRFMSILPSWHSFERTVEYVGLSMGATMAYSRPIPKVLLKDFPQVTPTFMCAVPRVLEGIHSGVMANVRKQGWLTRALFHSALWVGGRADRARMVRSGMEPDFGEGRREWGALLAPFVSVLLAGPHWILDRIVCRKIRERVGGRLRAIVSGGGALAAHVEDFYRAVGLTVLEGYGLTETSPVVAVRTFARRVPQTVGPPVPETEIRVVDEKGNPLPAGSRGIVQIRGPQVMQGYHRNPEETRKVIDREGWFDSGDLGRFTLQGDLQITGRAKDTIVLLSGENVEPEPVEGKLRESPLISQAMVVGQDRKYLGALIVASPDAPAGEDLRPRIQEEIRRLVCEETGFRRSELIQRFAIIAEEFRAGEELTHTLKMKRNVILERYAGEIESLYAG